VKHETCIHASRLSCCTQDALVAVLVLEASQAPASHDSLHARYRMSNNLSNISLRDSALSAC
jgi:hypothetical protein